MVDPQIRRSMDINLTNSIVVIDEAHNAEDTCRNAGSLEFSSLNLDVWASELAGSVRKASLIEDFKQDYMILLEVIKKLKLCLIK